MKSRLSGLTKPVCFNSRELLQNTPNLVMLPGGQKRGASEGGIHGRDAAWGDVVNAEHFCGAL